jgi:hypothetical protein
MSPLPMLVRYSSVTASRFGSSTAAMATCSGNPSTCSAATGRAATSPRCAWRWTSDGLVPAASAAMAAINGRARLGEIVASSVSGAYADERGSDRLKGVRGQ